MSEETTNPVDGEAMPEVVDEQDALENDVQDSFESNPDEELEPQDPEGEEEEVDYEGKQYRVPKELKDALLRQADYTRKTQEVAETKRTLAQREESIVKAEQRQAEFLGDVAQLAALNDRLNPLERINWPQYLRTGGAEAQARWVEFQQAAQARDNFARQLQTKVQQRQADEEREIATLREQGRAELQKHIKGYSPELANKLADFGVAEFGFSKDEILQAEADPRSIRVLHLAWLGQQALNQRKNTEALAQGQQTRPVPTLKGGGGGATTNPARMGPAQMAKLLGYG